MLRARIALSCFSAVAASVLVASIVPAAGETSAIEWDDHTIETTANEATATEATAIEVPAIETTAIEAPASSMTLAALDPVALSAKEAEAERAPDRLIPPTNDRIVLSAEDTIVGIASFYDDPQETASGEQYNPNAFTAAAQLEIRGKFGGVQYGRLYRPAYGLGEYGGKKIIVRFNDVGPLRPGRKFDLSRAAMAHFDSTLDKGLLPDFKMTPLPLGRAYPEGPVTDLQLADLGIDDNAVATAYAAVVEEPKPIHTASIAQPKPPAVQVARPAQSKPPSALRVSAKPVKTAAVTPPKKIEPSKAADQTSTVTPWIKRVRNWIASPAAADQPAQRGGAPDKRRVAQAR